MCDAGGPTAKGQPKTTIIMDSAKSIGALTERWLASRIATGQFREDTERCYRANAKLWLDYIGHNTPINQITAEHFEDYLASSKRRDGRPLAPKSLNTRADPVRSFYQWAVIRRIVDINPTATVPRAKNPKAVPRSTSIENVRLVLATADDRSRTMIYLAYLLGFRRGEIARARVEHWNREAETILILCKGGDEKTLPVDKYTAEVLGQWVDQLSHQAGPMFPGGGPDGHLWPTSVGNIIRKTVRAAGIEGGISTHTFRHTFGIELARAKVPGHVLQAMLRHESLQTSGIYTTATADDLRGSTGPLADRLAA